MVNPVALLYALAAWVAIAASTRCSIAVAHAHNVPGFIGLFALLTLLTLAGFAALRALHRHAYTRGKEGHR